MTEQPGEWRLATPLAEDASRREMPQELSRSAMASRVPTETVVIRFFGGTLETAEVQIEAGSPEEARQGQVVNAAIRELQSMSTRFSS